METEAGFPLAALPLEHLGILQAAMGLCWEYNRTQVCLEAEHGALGLHPRQNMFC
jgi:hypothetical protein